MFAMASVPVGQRGERHLQPFLPLALLVVAGCSSTGFKVPNDSAVGDVASEVQLDTLAPADLQLTTSDILSDGDPDTTSLPELRDADLPLPNDVNSGQTVVGVDAFPGETSMPLSTDGATPIDAAIPDAPAFYDANGDRIYPPSDVHFSSDAAGLAELCNQTGGTIAMGSCARPSAEFRDLCNSGSACGCSHYCDDVALCVCSNGCFQPAYGCVGRAWTGCTVGVDQTCNDDPKLSVVHGHCVEGLYCQCFPHDISQATGKCL